ncbi:ATP-binding cassette domain-containing protein [Pararhodobacter sp. SW119]|uniref:ABC transporter ATP-binding protein n=1 Tax=Pararhodobacter sp. SW119 TaxID=2780075 RepID=UPI001AE03104|nr:ATP-binding cassette domain-containing protein [Pararhodobacter sp. SW119]
MHLKIRNLSKSFGQFRALSGVDLDVGPQEFVCLLGPSGCGKTTLLRIVAGLEPFDEGTLELGGRDLTRVGAQHRGFGIVFQSYSLFPHMTVAQNIGYGLRIRKAPGAAVAAKVAQLMEIVHLEAFADRYPWQLSGGQQQRVAIARALAVDPALLLLDEPLSALDARVRVELRTEIREVQRRLGIPTIMVTHDQEEALTMADKVVCMNAGTIEQIGSPQDVYARPRTRFVADFVGTSNLLEAAAAQALGPDVAGPLPVQKGTDHLLALRPEDITLTRAEDGEAAVVRVTYLGNSKRVALDWRGIRILADGHRGLDLEPGDRASLSVAPGAGVWVLP